jgi:anthranilate phosphoribosyltransferase
MLKLYLARIAEGAVLEEEEARRALDITMAGEADPVEIAGFLMALRMRGETVSEITGAAQAMRARVLRVSAPDDAIDTCGTGGDNVGTYNISTACAFVLAGADVKVAKHGNRAVSSRAGSAQVLEALGVNINLTPSQVSRCIAETGIGFMMAPLHHEAMKHVAPVRQALGTRTIFNLLGPLTNPAGVKRQLVGVYARQWLEPLAHVLQRLGATNAWVVHGGDGLDELTTTAESHVAALENGRVRSFTVMPEEAGLPRATAEALRGGDAQKNAQALRALLEGEAGAYRDIVLLNSAAAFIVAGKAANLLQGVELAKQSLSSGRARAALERLVALSRGRGA